VSPVYLMYHELERRGRPLCESNDGYARYVVSEQEFAAQLTRLIRQGVRGCSVSDARRAPETDADTIAITFDDGCETDLLAAGPALLAAGFGATFYVTTGFLNRRGYLTPAMVRELADAGFEIGCHGATHRYLTDLDPAALTAELAGPRALLEDLTGRAVRHASCPGGRWNRRVAGAAARAGFDTLATSRPGINGPAADPMRLARVAVLRGTTLDEFDRLRRPSGLWLRQARELALGGAKALLGNGAYERLRDLVLRS
jgi:peptidoglycan/xylan/chitin deacetylase (PgdA/CDA1 family)